MDESLLERVKRLSQWISGSVDWTTAAQVRITRESFVILIIAVNLKSGKSKATPARRSSLKLLKAAPLISEAETE